MNIRKLSHIAVALSLCMTVAMPLKGQQLQASLNHYSTDNGLASNAISYITQDSWGYIWLATWNGLSRFDGFSFYNYATGRTSGIPLLHNRIIDLSVDMRQNVWMRMYDGRIFVLNRTTDRIVNAFDGVAGNEDYKTSSPLMVTSSGDVIAIIDEVGIFRLRLDRQQISRRLITTGRLKPSVIVEGYGGDLWVGTNKGFHKLNSDDETLSAKAVFENENITCAQSNGYNIYAGTSSGKILTFAYGLEPTVLKEIGEAVSSIYVDSHHLLWFALQRQGISRLNMATGDVKSFVQRVPVPEYDVHGSSMAEVDGTLWVSMNHGGFGYYNREKDEMEYFHNDPANPWNLSNTVSAWLALPEGVLWESTSKRGLEKLMLQKKNIERRAMFSSASEQELTSSTLSLDNNIRAIYYDKRRKLLLMGNKNNTLIIVDQAGGRKVISTDSQGAPLGRIYGITSDRNGNYWISTKGNGLLRMAIAANGNYVTERFTHSSQDLMSLSSDNVYGVVEDKRGNIWIATYGGGVNLMVRKSGRYVFFHSGNSMHSYPHHAFAKVRTLALDRDGMVWVGTTDGILLMKYENNKVVIQNIDKTISPEHNISSNDIVCLAQSPKGNMWIGTNGGGLCICTGRDSDGRLKFETIGSQQGLPSEEIKSITFDNHGNAWFATDNTICSFDLKKRILSSFSMQDGVDNTICSENAAITLPDSKMMFGTINGYYLVDKQKLAGASAAALKLHITDFFIKDEIVSPRKDNLFDFYVPESKRVELPDRNTNFAFRFASLNYQLQHRVHYQYILEGYDDAWQNADKSRMATYEGVPAGTYQFKVRAFLLESPNRYDIKTITVVVPPPFLLSSDAVWIYMLLATLLVLTGLWLRQRKLRKEYGRLQQEQGTDTPHHSDTSK